MGPLKIAILALCGTLGALQANAHGVRATTGQLTPAVKQKPWWEVFLFSAQAAAQITISEADGYRYFKSDSLPNHKTGAFPGRGNPHSIKSHERAYRVILKPTSRPNRTPVGHNLFGIALNGVVFDAATAEYWNRNRNWNIEAITGGINLGIDSSNAHVQPDGTYHYHGIPHGLLIKGPYKQKPVLLGYAADGFPIYGPYGYRDTNNPASPLVELKPSWRTKSGTRPGGPGGRYSGKYTADWEYVEGTGDLDDCNGRRAVTPEFPNGTYHYVITRDFPNIGRCWAGFPDNSFKKQRGGGQAGGQGGSRPSDGGQRPGGGQRQGEAGEPPAGGPPQEALDVCKAARQGDPCRFKGRRGIVESQCMEIPTGDMACVPPHMIRDGGGQGGPAGGRPKQRR